MNIKILDSWLREYLKTDANPAKLQELLSLSGPGVERIEEIGEDFVYDIEITNNRVDLASVYGLAREAKTILNQQGEKSELMSLELAEVPTNLPNFPLSISDPSALARRYLAVTMEIPAVSDSPEWLKSRLEAAGIRSLNQIVDITNYVMLEVGHPLHVFDLDRLQGRSLAFRLAKRGEQLITLDGNKQLLTENDIVIADESDRIIDLPGIMGCQNSVVQSNTRRIMLFTEVNDPVHIRRTSMRLALRSMAATYNENSPDPVLARQALLRGIFLYLKLGATPSSAILDSQTSEPEPSRIQVNQADFEKYMNIELPKSVIVQILVDLGFKLIEEQGKQLTFEVPSFRQKDIQIKEDLVEEVARIYGYDKLPTVLPPFAFISDEYIRDHSQKYKVEDRIKSLLADLGWSELYNYSMISEEQAKIFSLPNNSIRMVNPMSQDLVVFRQSLIPSLVANAISNKTQPRVAIFEIANVYLPRSKNLPQEQPTLGLLCKGNYLELKGLIETVLNSGLIEYQFESGAAVPYLDQNQSATIKIGSKIVGYLGRLQPKLAYSLGLKDDYLVAELNFNELYPLYRFQEPLKAFNSMQEITEDLTYQVNSSFNWQQLTQALKDNFGPINRIEYLGRFEDYASMRIYSQPVEGKSILEEIFKFLETKFSLEIKRIKADSSV